MESPGDFNADRFHHRARPYHNRTAEQADFVSYWDQFHIDASIAGRFGSDACNRYMEWTVHLIDRWAPRAFRDIESGTPIFRSRCWQDNSFYDELRERPAHALGAPAANIARAGRANPDRVPCLYGAFEKNTCASELRPAAGWTIVTGRFETTRAVRALDLTMLDVIQSETSIFANSYADDLRQIGLLRGIGREFSEPAWPGSELVHYLAPQYFAEYFRRKHEPAIGALIYASTQRSGGRNIALFGGPELTEPDGILKCIGFDSEVVTSIQVGVQPVHLM